MTLLHLAITIAIILLLIIKFKLNAAMSLILGTIYMGLAAGVGLTGTAQAINSGFGNLMTGIGLSIAFGIMLGELLSASGAINSIARGMLKAFGKERATVATGLTGYICSIPVFYDVVYVVIIPLAKGLAKITKQSISLFVGALVAGAAITHAMVPPTPGPMAVASVFKIDLGKFILAGSVVGILTFAAVIIIYQKLFLARGWFNPATDIDEAAAAVDTGDSSSEEGVPSAGPSFAASVFPIVLPIALILLGTVFNAVTGSVPPVVAFVGDKTIALLIGAIAAFFLALKYIPRERVEKALGTAMNQCGLVLLITGAGGSLAAVLAKTNIGQIISGAVAEYHINIVLLTWLAAAIIRLAQGSGTVAMITAAGLMAPVLVNLPVSPLWIAFAACTGGLFCGHVNDSGYWVSTKLANLTTLGGFKTYTTVTGLVAVVGLILCLLGSTLLPAL